MIFQNYLKINIFLKNKLDTLTNRLFSPCPGPKYLDERLVERLFKAKFKQASIFRKKLVFTCTNLALVILIFKNMLVKILPLYQSI